MNRFCLGCLALAAGCVLALGCDQSGGNGSLEPAANAPETPAAADGQVTTAKPIKPEQVNLTTGDEKKLAEMIAAHKGKVVFVDYWATWCPPCVEYFPHTVELHNKYQSQGLETIAVTFDLLEDEPAAREFLAEQGATFENLLSKYNGAGTEANEAFQIDQVPHFRLYDRKGELRHKWDNKPEDAAEKIEALLAEKPEASE